MLIIVAIIAGAGAFYYTKLRNKSYTGPGLWPEYEMTTIEMEGRMYRLVVADSQFQRSQGLMYVRKPVKEFDGMIFRFPDSVPRVFWNHNTYMPLSVYWISGGRIVGKSKLPSIEESVEFVTVESMTPVDTVIEIIE